MRNISVSEIVLCAIVVVFGGSFGLQGLAISIVLVGCYMLFMHFNQSIMGGIHAVLQQVPLAWQVGAWALIALIATIGSITYSTSGVHARYLNTPVYLVSLALTVLYMLRLVSEHGLFKFTAVVWSIMTFACLMKMIPFVGWILAVVEIVLFLHLHYIAARTHQHQQQQQQHNSRHNWPFSSKVYVGSANDAAPWWGRKNLWQGNRVHYGYARIPVLRFANPLVWYCYDEQQGTAYRDTFLGSLDAQEIANIYDCNYPKSGGFYRLIRGTLHLEFDFTKYGKNTVLVWKNLHPEMAQTIHAAHAAKKK